MKTKRSRRQFLERAMIGAAGAVIGLPVIERSRAFAARGEMPYRTLGSTGEKVSLLGLGGYHIGVRNTTDEESFRIVRAAIDAGVNFMDNSWDYNGGQSELRMGRALRDGYRKKVFLMTKTNGQVKDLWNKQLEESLRRLQTDVIDLVQFHEVNLPDDPEVIFGPNGAVEAAMAAKKAGKIRYIGFTGHTSPDVLLKMIKTANAQKFRFDSVQMPLNVVGVHYHSFAKAVVPVLVQQGIAVLGMKSLANGAILKHKANPVTAGECLRYAMNLRTSVVINGCESMKDLEQGLAAARSFKPMEEAEVAALLARTTALGATGECEIFKTMDPQMLRRSKAASFVPAPSVNPE